MWRSIVMAVGLSMCLLGAEFMVVERMVLADDAPIARSDTFLDSIYSNPSGYRESSSLYGRNLDTSRTRVFVPPEWAPWGFLSAGVLAVLYGASIPRR